ncbi:E3 ubiquitin-protein ligase RNF10 [Chironomus tepperi]|uniref:E3 ubiquitin-protein ligase RNF10 n=1 Tax=Chironomus tepperi TaxID=113505 RepID=UPI00391F3F54
MEKKRNQSARSGQMASDFYSKKNQDVSTKQHFRRRKETFQSEYSNNNNNKPQSYNNNKTRNNGNNNGNFYYDKRPPRKNGNVPDERNGGAIFGETTGLMDDDFEINSVFNPGSKKQNLNHLLNFHKYTKESDDLHRYRGAFSKHGYRHRVASKKYNYRKEQYLQANCQFIVKEDVKYDYKPFTNSPDTLVEWDQVVKVLISSCEEIQCPICLYPPKAAKMTKCGHIYCFSCMLHYLSLSDKEWRKCPICYESVYLSDLKSTTSKHNHISYKVGDIITMELMKREKGSLFVNKANEIHNIIEFPSFSDIKDSFTFSKLIMANKSEMLKVIEQEKYELDFQLAEDGIDCPESIFVHQALDLLNLKQKEIEREMENQQQCANFHNNIKEQMQQSLESSKSLENNAANEPMFDLMSNASTDDMTEFSIESVIDEDCDLTVNDIDIVSEPSTVQSKHFYYYQSPNSQNVFLHSVNSKMLQLMYGSLQDCPQEIRGKIVQIECCTMNEDLRKRLKYLQHLPVSSVFEVVEIEFNHGIISKDVHNLFKDELFIRRKKRQFREKQENKREKVINEINDRQMGKMLKSASANIDICSTAQFPECGILDDMPALPSNEQQMPSSSSKSLPSFANMLTSPTGRDSQKLWPSLASGKPSTSNSSQSNSFFGDKKFIHAAGSKTMAVTSNDTAKKDDDDDYDDSDVECKAPVYKNNLSDALANALKSASINEVKIHTGKKKKSKKTLIFSSGMNFN